MARNPIVIGNWKMYKTSREAAAYLEELLPQIEGCKAKVFLAVPYTSIAAAAKAAKGSEVLIGAQNMNDARDGAFTGEIAALMLKEAGAAFVLLGHSERRKLFGETNEFIQRKVVRALQDDLIPVLCVGETAEQREEGKTEEVLRRQIEECLEGIPVEEASKLMLAYEPVWAIGTGKTATPEMAAEAHASCRAVLADLFGKKRASAIPLLYGGSVKPENAAALLAQKGIDGLLVGGASLEPEVFAQIASASKKSKGRL
jgi:triosephosphate isomerase